MDQYGVSFDLGDLEIIQSWDFNCGKPTVCPPLKETTTNSSCFGNTCVEYDGKDALTDLDRQTLLVVFRCMANERPMANDRLIYYYRLYVEKVKSSITGRFNPSKFVNDAWYRRNVYPQNVLMSSLFGLVKDYNLAELSVQHGSTMFNYWFMHVEQRKSWFKDQHLQLRS